MWDLHSNLCHESSVAARGIFFFFFKLRHVESLDVACELLSSSMWDLVPDQGSNLGCLHWELGVLATGPPGKSQEFLIKDSNLSFRRIPLKKKRIPLASL